MPERLPDFVIHTVLSELLYIAEGTALDDPKTAKFCILRIQQLSQGVDFPLMLKPQVYRDKLEQVMRMLKPHEAIEAREMPSLPKVN